jgi:hypothetical protein
MKRTIKNISKHQKRKDRNIKNTSIKKENMKRTIKNISKHQKRKEQTIKKV